MFGVPPHILERDHAKPYVLYEYVAKIARRHHFLHRPDTRIFKRTLCSHFVADRPSVSLRDPSNNPMIQ